MTAPQTTQLKISGMNCASCVGRVETALQAVPGVNTAAVNFATGTAQVVHKGPISDLTTALINAGYPAASTQVTLKIDGMNCASCVAKIEKTLSEDPAVIKAQVNLATETAAVTYIDGATDPQRLSRLSKSAGYPARIVDGAMDAPAERGKSDEVRALTPRDDPCCCFSFSCFRLGNGWAFATGLSPLGSHCNRSSNQPHYSVRADLNPVDRTWARLLR